MSKCCYGRRGGREIYDREKWIKNTDKYRFVELQHNLGDIQGVSAFDIRLLGTTRLSSEAAFAVCAWKLFWPWCPGRTARTRHSDARPPRHSSRVGRGARGRWPGQRPAPRGKISAPRPAPPSGERPRFLPGFRIPGSPAWPILPRSEPRTGLACSRISFRRCALRSCSLTCLLARIRAPR